MNNKEEELRKQLRNINDLQNEIKASQKQNKESKEIMNSKL